MNFHSILYTIFVHEDNPASQSLLPSPLKPQDYNIPKQICFLFHLTQLYIYYSFYTSILASPGINSVILQS